MKRTHWAIAAGLCLLAAACSPADEKEPTDDVGVEVDAGSDATNTSTADAATNNIPGDEFCPVVDYEACGGDLLGTWEFRSLCPDDAAAAAALCEHIYADREACTGEGNEAICEGNYDGTLTFNDDGSATLDAVDTLIASWHMTDACLDDVKPGMAAADGCAALTTDRLTCTYDTSCVCVGRPLVQDNMDTFTYTVTDNDVQLGGDPPASYCVDGDRLTMDYYVFHPVSWRYWVFERSQL